MNDLSDDYVAIRSFLVHASPGMTASVSATIAAMAGCSVYPALNQDVIVVVTETHGQAEEDALDRTLAAVPGVDGVALVSGFIEEG